MPEFTCEVCGKEFHRTPSLAKTEHHFCSRECKRKFDRGISMPEVVCEICGKIIYRSPNKQKLAKHHFCSREHTREYYSKIRQKEAKG